MERFLETDVKIQMAVWPIRFLTWFVRMTKVPTIVLGWTLRALFIYGAVISNSGSVLCIAESGQVKIEQVCQPWCSDPDVECSEQIAAEVRGHEGCSDCTDMPLLLEALARRLADGDLSGDGSPAGSAPMASIQCVESEQASHRGPIPRFTQSSHFDKIISAAVLRC